MVGRGTAVALALGLALLAAGCSVGAYPFDVFPEMHYQPSYRAGEPPRLSPPASAVPITGKEVDYTFTEAQTLAIPLAPSPSALAAGWQLYGVNCAACHGPGGRGDGPMAARFQAAGAVPPVDYASPRVQARSAGELYWILTNGLGNMPPFGKLLASQERWLLVLLVQEVAQKGEGQ